MVGSNEVPYTSLVGVLGNFLTETRVNRNPVDASVVSSASESSELTCSDPVLL